MKIYYAGEWWYFDRVEDGFSVYQNSSGEEIRFPVQDIPDESK